MTDKVTIFRPNPAKRHPISELTDVYLQVRKRGHVPGTVRHELLVALDAEVYYGLCAVAARQGLGISAFLNRVGAGIVEEYGDTPSVPFSA